MELLCPSCGALTPAKGRFCKECAYDLRTPTKSSPIDYSQPQSYTPKYLADKILTTRSSIEGERKLVTVLFADVANYTSIAENLDPEEVHQIMDGCFKVLMNEIHRFEGTINQFTGDGVMALFGAPLAHEDHGQRACHAALSIQKAIEGYGENIKGQHGAEFKLRIGLNSGPVIVGSIGDDLRMDYTAVGDTTNLAHRMQDMADPGAVLVSGHTHRLARDFFELISLGKIEVKGKEEPQEAYELLRTSEVETRIEAAAAKGLTRFVGRGKELETLKGAFESAKSGSGKVIGVVGEAGVGKSRLLLELRGMIPKDEYSFLEGRCLHYGGSMPYLPILDVIKAYFDVEEDDREATIKEKVRKKLKDLDEEAGIVPPALHEVLTLKVEDDKYVQLDPQQRRDRTFEAVRDLIVRESQKNTLILAVEDLHWIDKTSEEFLDYLIGFLPTARILLILLYRPEYTHAWGSKSYYDKIGLDQLPAQTSAELVQAILEDGRVAPEIAGLVLEKAGGNPLFVEELTHSLVENGSIQRKNDRFVLSQKPSEIDVPDTIQGIIAARMDRIEDNLKRIMQVASVIGREFAYRILQSITDMSEDLKASLVNLQGLEFIYEKQLFPELEYIFKHALTQEVAYNSLLLKRRKEIHERIGEAIEALYSERLEEYYELLAYHYLRSDNRQKAVDFLSLANEKACRASAGEEAKSYFDECMELLDTMPDTENNRKHRIALLVNAYMMFQVLMRMSEYHELMKRHESLLAGMDSPRLAGSFYVSLAWCEMVFGFFDSSIDNAKRGAELCELAGYVEEAGRALFVLQWNHLFKGNLERSISLKGDVLRKGGDRFTPRLTVVPLCISAYAHIILGRWEEAEQECKRALRIAEQYLDDSLRALGTFPMCFLYTYRNEPDRAIEYAELGVKAALTPFDKAISQATLAWVLCRAGETEKGIHPLAEIVQLFRAGGIVSWSLLVTGLLAEACLLSGDYNRARETAEEAVELGERYGAKFTLTFAYRMLGEVDLRTNPDEAAPPFEQAISISQEIKAENELALAYSGMGRYHKQQGNVGEAREYLTKALEIFERLGTLIEPDKVREELAGLP
jgi:class 3 adenylate cyclase/tetratricopeptide (TPR) repeat protein